MVVENIQVNPEWKTPLSVDGLNFRSSMDFHITKGGYDRAFQDLSESEDIRVKSLENLRKKLNNVKDLVSRQDDEYLLRYLRYSKFDCNRAYTVLRKLYEERAKNPELFVLPPNLRSMLDKNIVRWLPHTDDQGRVVFFMKFGNWDLEEMSFDDLMIMVHALSDIISMNPMLQIQGTVGIWDFAGITASHIAYAIHPQRLQVFINALQNMYPWRIKTIVAVNCNMLCRATYKSIRYLLKKKVRDRIIILGSDLSELHHYFNPAILPKEYGGTLEDNEFSITDIVMHNLPYLEYERTFGYVSKA